MSRWSLEDLSTLAEARRVGLTYAEAQEKHFPDRTRSAVRSAAQTKRYKEIEEAQDSAPRVYQPGEHGDVFRFPEIDLELDADTFAELVGSYVSAGRGLTRDALAREFGLPRDHVDHICRVYGLTKDSPPVPVEFLQEASDEEVIERSLEGRAQKIQDQVDARRARHFERLYRNLKYQQENERVALERLEDWLREREDVIGSAHDVINPCPKTPPAESFTAHIPVADLHAGKLAWAPETGWDYDTEVAAHRLAAHGVWASGHLAARRGVCNTAYVTDVGDFLHAILSSTESGTALDKDTRDLRVFDLIFEAKVAQIEAIRRNANHVVVMAVPGNHDHIFARLFHRMVGLYYRDVQDVEVRRTYGRYAGFVVGNTSHLLDHGKGVRSLSGWKAKAQLRTVRKHALDEDELALVRNDVYYVGHLHELQVGSHTDSELRRLFPMCEPDDFEVSLRFSASPGAELFFLNEDGRIGGIERFYPSREE